MNFFCNSFNQNARLDFERLRMIILILDENSISDLDSVGFSLKKWHETHISTPNNLIAENVWNDPKYSELIKS